MSEYYESAEGLTITRKRALRELADHGCENFKEFFNDCGDEKHYPAQAVLDWLGY
jgi:hypothetical protein